MEVLILYKEEKEMLELNVPYTSKDLAQQLFKVSSKTFTNKKKKYLEYLKQFYQFDTQGRKIILRKELKPFETRMENRKQTVEKNTSTYRDLTHKIIGYKSLNSGSNIAREIYDNPFKPLDHEEGTIAKYVRGILKEDFEVMDKQWCRINYGTHTYEPLSFEEKCFLMELFKETNLNKKIMDITADFKCGNISRKEFQEQVGFVAQSKYNRVMEEFKRKFGFRPYKVPNWQKRQGVI